MLIPDYIKYIIILENEKTDNEILLNICYKQLFYGVCKAIKRALK